MSVFTDILPLAGLAPALLGPAALVLDALWGEPPARLHPVCLMGRLARWNELFWRGRSGPGPTPPGARGRRLPGGLFTAGALAALGTVLPFVLAAGALPLIAGALPLIAGALPFIAGASLGTVGDFPLLSAFLRWFCAALLVYFCLAPRSLGEHALAVASPLQTGGEDALPRARETVSMLVGRDTAALDAHGLARACIESVGENLTDGVLASLFWAAVGGLAGALASAWAESWFGTWPGIEAGLLSKNLAQGLPASLAAACAVLHRASNVLDALWGKRDEAYARFGTWAARLDDGLNFFPARLSLPLIALAALVTPGCSAAQALRQGWRCRKAHASPNSAWSEAAFAGALGLRLGGPVAYRGRPVAYPWLGVGRAEAKAADILCSIRLMWAASLLGGLCFAVTSAVACVLALLL